MSGRHLTMLSKTKIHQFVKHLACTCTQYIWYKNVLLHNQECTSTRMRISCLISENKEFVKDVNKIIFNFIWKGKDKVKLLDLISDIVDGGLKDPHLDSITETHRVLCCKRLASNQPSNWKKILLHYLEPVQAKFILCCDFDLKKLPIKLPAFYNECF